MSFQQLSPHRVCQSQGIPRNCRNPRCSLNCRFAYALKESETLIRWLKALPNTASIYFGVLKVLTDITEDEHRRIRSRFLRLLASEGIKFYSIGEIGDDSRIHYHYVLYRLQGSVHKTLVKKLWTAACENRPTKISHDPPVSIEACAKYLFKATKDVCTGERFLRLFRKGSISLTWGSRGFYARGAKVAMWKQAREEWYESRQRASNLPHLTRLDTFIANRIQTSVQFNFDEVNGAIESIPYRYSFNHRLVAMSSNVGSTRNCNRNPSKLRANMGLRILHNNLRRPSPWFFRCLRLYDMRTTDLFFCPIVTTSQTKEPSVIRPPPLRIIWQALGIFRLKLKDRNLCGYIVLIGF